MASARFVFCIISFLVFLFSAASAQLVPHWDIPVFPDTVTGDVVRDTMSSNNAVELSIKEMGIASMLPYVAMVIGSNAAGWLADYIIGRTGNITGTRKVFHTVALGSAAVLLIMLPQAESKVAVITLVTLALGMMSLTGSTTGPNAMDIAPRYAGIIMGIQTTAGNISGAIVPVVVGLIVSATGNWSLIFYLAATVLVAAVIVWDLFATGEQVLE